MTKVPWKIREVTRTVFKATKPGQCVSVDQMISMQVGFYAQLKERLTKQRYRCATIFVDHFSGYKYIHLMTHLLSEETVAAKRAFERLFGGSSKEGNGGKLWRGISTLRHQILSVRRVREPLQDLSFRSDISSFFPHPLASHRLASPRHSALALVALKKCSSTPPGKHSSPRSPR
jgi:hypothetical protein